MHRTGRGLGIALSLFIAEAASLGADPNGFAPSPGARWHDSFAQTGRERVVVGDFNGDGRDDLLSCERGRIQAILASPTAPRFEGPVDWGESSIPDGAVIVAGDVDGDRFDDLVYFTKASVAGDEADDAWVLFADRRGFGARVRLYNWFCPGGEIPAVADVNGDGRADILSFVPGGDGAVWVGLSAGRAAISDVRKWTEGFLGEGELPLAADFNGDGRADIAAVVREADQAARGHVRVALAGDGAFGPKHRWSDRFCIGPELPFAGDVDGDGAADLLTFVRGQPDAARGPTDSAGDVYTALSEVAAGPAGRAFGPGTLRHPYFCVGRETPLVGDFDGDRKTDICTLVGPTVAANSPLRGDVRVARSTHGRSASWEVRLESVKVVSADESSGDDPYFVLIGYRVRANAPDSVQVWSTNLRGGPWPANLTAGATANLPAAAATLTIPNVEAWTANEIEGGRMPELVGMVLTCMESDGTSWEDMAGAVATAEGHVRFTMQNLAREHRVRPESRWRDLKGWIAAAAGGLQAFAVHRPGSANLSDNDDTVGKMHFYYPAVDAGALSRLNLDAGIDFGTRTLTEQHWTLGGRPLIFSSDGSVWHLQMRMRRTDTP